MTLDRRSLLLAAPAAAPLLAGAAPAGAQRADAVMSAHGIDAVELGIIADSGVPLTTALQGAIDQAAGRRRALLLPPGVIETGPLALRPGSRLAGTGRQTTLRLVGAGPLLEASDAPEVVLFDLALEAPAAGDAAAVARFADCDGLALAHLAITGGGNGIALERCGGAIRECRFAGAAGAAIFSLDATGLAIVGNLVEDCANNGILVWRSAPGADGTIVARNRVRRITAEAGGSGQNGNGINLFRAGHVIVEANRIDNCAFSAVRANSASDCQIIANSCSGLGEVAIYAEFAFEGAVISGNIVDGAATGIAITNFNEGGRLAVCSGNIVRNLALRDGEDRRGNGITAEADTVVTGNVVEGAPIAGLVLGWGPHLRNVSATGNVIRDCGVGIAVSVARRAGAALISNNLIAAPGGVAIQGYEWDRAVGGELVGGTDRWPHLTISGNVGA